MLASLQVILVHVPNAVWLCVHYASVEDETLNENNFVLNLNLKISFLKNTRSELLLFFLKDSWNVIKPEML